MRYRTKAIEVAAAPDLTEEKSMAVIVDGVLLFLETDLFRILFEEVEPRAKKKGRNIKKYIAPGASTKKDIAPGARWWFAPAFCLSCSMNYRGKKCPTCGKPHPNTPPDQLPELVDARPAVDARTALDALR